MNNDTTPPLVVTDNTIEGQITTLVRYVLTTLGGFALGRGWIDNDLLQVLVALATIAAPTAYGIYKTAVRKRQLIVTAAAAPAHVAQVVHK